jgi:hypothetical protein
MHGRSAYGGFSNIIHIFFEHYLLGPKFMELEGRRFLIISTKRTWKHISTTHRCKSFHGIGLEHNVLLREIGHKIKFMDH